ncbi:hypothetical protein PUN28_001219 [Cardiocondyla obscurior]|uniref:Uncharacterized protein n=1 Tax=Cardiocondyla obscurior TaxID=286306 RepID=A0AAW2H3Y5_9HYME
MLSDCQSPVHAAPDNPGVGFILVPIRHMSNRCIIEFQRLGPIAIGSQTLRSLVNCGFRKSRRVTIPCNIWHNVYYENSRRASPRTSRIALIVDIVEQTDRSRVVGRLFRECRVNIRRRNFVVRASGTRVPASVAR